jgi:hypothetical protein
MSRLTDALLGQNAFGRGSTNSMLDLTYGGMFDYAPDLTQWVSNQAYMRNNLVCILLESPKFFNLMPEPAKWHQTLKAIFETHAMKWEGFEAGLTVDTDTHAVGGAGELQDEIVNVTRKRSEPSLTVIDKYGLPMQTFFYNWITYGLMDPDTKYALVGTLDKSKRPSDMLADWYSASALFFEPDPTQTRVVKSWVTTNMFPKETGDIRGVKDQLSGREKSELTIPFTGISKFGFAGNGTNAFAQKILDAINLVNAVPSQQPSFIQSISADVQSASSTGYFAGVDKMAKNAIIS